MVARLLWLQSERKCEIIRESHPSVFYVYCMVHKLILVLVADDIGNMILLAIILISYIGTTYLHPDARAKTVGLNN